MDKIDLVKMDIKEHQEMVKQFAGKIIALLEERVKYHDMSKLMPPEVEIFADAPKRNAIEYQSEEYKDNIKVKLEVALKHHYARNRHHPEHFENGISDMNLIDLLELVCDWKASSLGQDDGNVLTQMTKNKERFKLDEQLYHLIKNTMELFELI